MVQAETLLARALELIQTDERTAVTNTAAVIAALRQEYGVTDYRARIAIAKAARRRRYATLPDDQRHISPSIAAREFGGSASNIRRACGLGLIEGASKSGLRNWTFTVASFKHWLETGEHTPGRKGNTTGPEDTAGKERS